MEKTALVVIDVQIGIVEGVFHQAELLSQINVLLQRARSGNIPVIYVQHDGPSGHRVEPDTRGWPIHPAIEPRSGEPVVHKRASDSFFETELPLRLQERQLTRLVIAGCMTEYCVDTTCRRAVTLGYDVVLVRDAHTTSDTPTLTAAQIIAHHNELLDGFSAGAHEIRVLPASDIPFL